MRILDFIKPTPHSQAIEDQGEVDKNYKYWRMRIFYAMYIGYAFFYFTRKSFTFAMPVMISELGMTKTQLGYLASTLYFTYGISKFVSGVLSDKSNPRFIMAMGLVLTGVFNIFFGFSSSMLCFALFWGLNGWFQGWGWPPCARLLTHWYSQKERGTWWGIWNTSHNIGGALIPLVVAESVKHFGSWRFAMWIPGSLSVLAGLFLLNRLRDTPQSLGLPPIEEHRNDYPERNRRKVQEEAELTTKDILFKYVLKNKFIWVLAISYFFVYIIRTAINDWGLIFLKEAKGLSLIKAGMCVTAFEIGGFVGSLASGWFSDKIFGGRRGPVNVLFTAGAIFALFSMWAGPFAFSAFYMMIMFVAGFFIFGPQMLIGMAAAELSHKKAAGTATGFAGWFAYFGATLSGFLGTITDQKGWYAFFVVLGICGIISVFLLLPLWNAKARMEKTEKAVS
jgi:OPA family sugar phosphate sensor protein UhpC-like MFS transporter